MSATGQEERAAELNRRLWNHMGVAEYDRTDLRPVEVLLLIRHREALQGTVLEIGCGAGRVTRYLAELARELQAIDVSPAMIDHVRRTLPAVHAALGDASEMPEVPTDHFDAVVASCNVLDALDPHGRARALAEVRRVLHPGALLLFSAHNRAAASAIPPPTHIERGAGPRRFARDLAHLPVRLRNHRERRPLEHETEDYAILTDVAHDYGVLHYYVERDAQVAQLADAGFTTRAVYDLDGHAVPRGERAPWAHELHYAATS